MDAFISDLVNTFFQTSLLCILIIIILLIIIFFFNMSREDKIGIKHAKNFIIYLFSKKGLLQSFTLISFFAIGSANIFILKIAFGLLFVVFLLCYIVENWKDEEYKNGIYESDRVFRNINNKDMREKRLSEILKKITYEDIRKKILDYQDRYKEEK